MYKTMLILSCYGAMHVYHEGTGKTDNAEFNRVVAFGNNRDTILLDGAFMPLRNMRNNFFEIEHNFILKDYSASYKGSYDYNTNTLNMSIYRTDSDGTHQKTDINA